MSVGHLEWNMHEQYVEENLVVARNTLAPEAVQNVRTILEEAVLNGYRYPALGMSLLHGDTLT